MLKKMNSADWFCIGMTIIGVVIVVYSFVHGWNTPNCTPATNGTNYGC